MSNPEHPFAKYIRILGKGKSGTRSLNQAEAEDAFDMILRGEVNAVQIGAFLMLLRVKEESPEEIAGFVRACKARLNSPTQNLVVDLDWSSYAGKRNQHPWFVLAILLLAQAGYRIMIHGTQGHTAGRLYTEEIMRRLCLPVSSSWQGVGSALDTTGICYIPLEAMCRPLQDLIELRSQLGLRSPVNTLTRLINPLNAPASMQSIFHPAYVRIHQEADALLGQERSLVFRGESGEIEVKPQADTRIFLQNNGVFSEMLLPRSLTSKVDPISQPSVAEICSVWRDERHDQYGVNAVIATTAAALILLRPGLECGEAMNCATLLWNDRKRDQLK